MTSKAGKSWHEAVALMLAVLMIALAPCKIAAIPDGTPGAAPPPAPINVPITVQEALPAGVQGNDRSNEPVTVGIPLPDSATISDVGQLGLSGSSAGQFRALAWYPSGNIRWVLCDFQTSVGAGATATAVLTDGTGNFGGVDLAGDSGSAIVVDTGAAHFSIKKANFNLFDAVTVGGTTLVSAGNGGGFIARDSSNNVYSSANDPSSSAVIEENGPVRACVRATGSFKDGSGTRLMDYTLRLHFFKGKSYVKAYATLRNAIKKAVASSVFNSAEVVVPVAIGPSKTVEFARKADSVAASLASSDNAYLYQGFSKDKLIGFDANGNPGNMAISAYNWDPPVPGTASSDGTLYSYDMTKAGLAVVIGDRTLNSLGDWTNYTNGWAELRDSNNAGVTLAYRWMSAMWPAGFEFSGDGTTSIALYSRRNAKTGLHLLWQKHDTRELLWDFHTSSADNTLNLYRLQYPLVARASLSQYTASGAFYGQSEIVTADQQNAWFSAHGKTAPPLSNPPLSIYRIWAWPLGGGDNQTDFPLNDLLDWVRTGHAGFYLAGEQRTIFNGSTAVKHSDDFVSEAVNGPSDSNKGVSGDFFDMEHAHILSLPIYYYLSGNEFIREDVLDYGEYLDRTEGMQNYFTIGSGTPTEYFRAFSRKLRNFALIYEFTVATRNPNPRYKAYVEYALRYLLDSRDDPAKSASAGRNLQRGYIYWDTTLTPRVVHSFFHTQIHFEAIWQVLRVMNDTRWNYSRSADVEDYMLGLAQFFLKEYYDEKNGGIAITDFGFEYDYPIDNGYVPDNLVPYSFSRAALLGYSRTGDATFLAKAEKLLWAITTYATPRSPSELQEQALMYAYFRKPAIWKPLAVTATGSGGSYTLSWTAPARAGRYQIKYSDKTIVDWLGFNKLTHTYQYSPSDNVPFFAAQSSSNAPSPAPAGTGMQFSITGLDPTKSWKFQVRYLDELSGATPAPPSGLRIIK